MTLDRKRTDESPFGILGLTPTLDSKQVRRAYFALLQRFPPQSDPEGFGRLRRAYEQLADPESLGQAFLSAPVDLDVAIAPYEARFGQAVTEITGRMAIEQDQRQALARFIEHFSRLPLNPAVR